MPECTCRFEVGQTERSWCRVHELHQYAIPVLCDLVDALKEHLKEPLPENLKAAFLDAVEICRWHREENRG